MVASEGNSGGYARLTHLAKRHSRQELNIRPELYDLWLASLVQAVREHDSQWTPQTEQVWRRIMQPGIAFMKAAFE
jgi:hypothetical protein